MRKIKFITGNKNKFEEAKEIIPDLEQLNLDLPEIQELDPHKILMAKIFEARRHHSGIFVAEDVSLKLSCIKNLPGPLTKWFGEVLGAEGVADLVHRYDDHRAVASVILAYSEPEKEPIFFEGSVSGIIVKVRGKIHFGFDPIFQPDEWTKTYGEMTSEEKNQISHRAQAFRKLKEFLNRV